MLEAVGDVSLYHVLVVLCRAPLKARKKEGRPARALKCARFERGDVDLRQVCSLPIELESWVCPIISTISPESNEIQRCIIARIRHIVDIEPESQAGVFLN